MLNRKKLKQRYLKIFLPILIIFIHHVWIVFKNAWQGEGSVNIFQWMYAQINDQIKEAILIECL